MRTYSYGAYSESRLITCHEKIQEVMRTAIRAVDLRALWGFRNEEQQNEFFNQGHSEKQWPNSLHNKFPSLAIDIVPYPVDWKNTDAFYYAAGHILMVAEMLDIDMRWGGDWNRNDILHDQKFYDLGHFELVVY